MIQGGAEVIRRYEIARLHHLVTPRRRCAPKNSHKRELIIRWFMISYCLKSYSQKRAQGNSIGVRLMSEQSVFSELEIMNPLHWPDEKLLEQIDRVAKSVSSTPEKGHTVSVNTVQVLGAKLSLYSNELARRSADRAAAAADREAASNRRLTTWAIGIAVGSLLIAIIQAVLGYLALTKCLL
jgi:hypothetical protein